MRRLLAACLTVAACAASAVVAVETPLRAQTDGSDREAPEAVGPEGVLSAEFDAFAVRVEYDIPLPVSPGTVPHVVGEVRRSGAGENSKGLAAAPTHFDAVVGGTYYDPDKNQKGDENLPPQVECFYPGASVDTRFDFPTDTRAETEGAPATAYAIAQCAAGPTVQLRVAAGAADLPSVAVRGGAAEGEARPVESKLISTAFARGQGIELAGGAVKVGAVEASGASEVTGKPGGAVTQSRVTLQDVDVAGVRFSIANDRLLAGGQEVPVDSAPARAVVDAANAALALAAPGCRVALTTEPDTFPQGFLLARKPPQIGVADDGSAAASMRAGMQVVCDIPNDLSEPTGFSPQRFQAVLGFVYTGSFASSEPSGFSLGNLGDLGLDGSGGGLGSAFDGSGSDLALDATQDVTALPASDAALAAPPAPAVDQPGAAADPGTKLVRRYRTVPVSAVTMSPASRALLFLLALAAWLVLTHLGLKRVRGVTRA